jgi:hypothetical protein
MLLSFSGFSYQSQPLRRDPEYYAREFERTTSSNFPLDGLVEDLDLRGFLPAEPVLRGERWNPRGKPVMDALFGLTELGLLGIPTEVTEEALLRDVFLQPFRECGDKQLEIACEYLGEELSMNPPGAKIRLRLGDKYEIDATSDVNRYLESAFPSNTHWQVRDFFVVWELDGRGDLIWNVAEHRAESLALEADLKLECSFEFLGFGNGPMHIRLSFSGKLQWTMRAERAP